MTAWVKVCGVTDPTVAAVAVEAGVDALGFVLAPDSPRAVTPRQAEALIRGVDVSTFVVTVDLEADRVVELAAAVGASGVQPHGRYAVEAAREALASGFEVLFPVPVRDAPPDLGAVPSEATPLLDRAHPTMHGGSGRPFDWQLVGRAGRRFVLAGGLGPDNVREAIATAAPWGVDASSRLESAPGRKDPAKVVAFIEEAKRP